MKIGSEAGGGEQFLIPETFWNWILAYKQKQALFPTWLEAVALKMLCDQTKNELFVRKDGLIRNVLHWVFF